MPLLPTRINRSPEDCKLIWTRRPPDYFDADGELVEGQTTEIRQAAGTGWAWLGRVWRWKDK